MTTDRISEVDNERLLEIAVEYGEMAAGLRGKLQDGPGTASTFYMSASLGEIASIAAELARRRSSQMVVVEWRYLDGGRGNWKHTASAEYAALLASNPKTVIETLYTLQGGAK